MAETGTGTRALQVMTRIGNHLHPLSHRLAGLLLAVPCVILSVLFWRVDVYDPLTVSALLVDRILQVGTLGLLPLALLAVALGTWSVARAGAVVAGLVSLLLGASTSLAALRPPVEALPTICAVASLTSGLVLVTWATLASIGSSWRWQLSLLSPLALLPALQFWHQTSFVPANLTTSINVAPRFVLEDVDATGDRLGAMEIAVRNEGSVGAVILAAESIVCFRDATTDVLSLDYEVENLYGDRENCRTDEIIDELSQIDAKSSWNYHRSFRLPPGKALAQTVTQIWYARVDRLRVDDAPPSRRFAGCRGSVTIHPIRDEARFKGVVQRDRVLVYDDDGSGVGAKYFFLTTRGQSPCEERPPFNISEAVGAGEIRVNREDWLVRRAGAPGTGR